MLYIICYIDTYTCIHILGVPTRAWPMGAQGPPIRAWPMRAEGGSLGPGP